MIPSPIAINSTPFPIIPISIPRILIPTPGPSVGPALNYGMTDLRGLGQLNMILRGCLDKILVKNAMTESEAFAQMEPMLEQFNGHSACANGKGQAMGGAYGLQVIDWSID